LDFAVRPQAVWRLAATPKPALASKLSKSRCSADITSQGCRLTKEEIMKIRYFASAAIAASAVTIGLAPVALAETAVHQNPGNAEIVATPGPSAQNAANLQQPFGGYNAALLFHH
jgi:hypothetical protein